jgi:hypothetical protein
LVPLQTYFDAICQKLVLPIQVLLLNSIIQLLVFLFENEHRRASTLSVGPASISSGRSRRRYSNPLRRRARGLLRDAGIVGRVTINETDALFEQLIICNDRGLRSLQQFCQGVPGLA